MSTFDELDPSFRASSPQARAAADAAEAGELLAKIEQLLDDSAYHWAQDTLEGIHETVERELRVTSGQRRAVENIEESVRRRRGW